MNRQYLLADTARIPAEDNVSTEQTGKERVVGPFFGPRRVQVFHGKHCTLIANGECGEVPRMLTGGFED